MKYSIAVLLLFAASPAMAQQLDIPKSWSDDVTFELDVFSIAFTLLCLALFYLFFLSKAKDAEIPDKLKAYIKRKIDERLFDYGRTQPNHDFERQLNLLDKKIMDLSREAIITKNTPVTLEVTNGSDLAPEPVFRQPEPQEEVYFLPTPNPDGSFPIDTLSSGYREGASIYKMTKTTASRAGFQLDDNETSIKLALQYPELRIEPCCNALNAYPGAGTKRIILKAPGVLELQGEKWMVITKANISYEN